MIARSIIAVSLIALSTINPASAAAPANRLNTAECNTPNYRSSWQDDELTGNVKLAVLVDANGKVQDSKVISSSGHIALDKASQRASAGCKFQPASNGSEPVWAQVQYNWVLN